MVVVVVHSESKNPGPYDFLAKLHQKAQILVIFDRGTSVHLHLQVTSLMLLRTTNKKDKSNITKMISNHSFK